MGEWKCAKIFEEWKRTNDKGLLAKLVKMNEPLAVMYARRSIRHANLQLDEDIMQAARIGLLVSLQGYDTSKGAFSTWSWHQIRYEIQKHLQKAQPYTKAKGSKLSAQLLEDANKFRALFGEEPTHEDLGITQEAFYASQESVRISSLDDRGEDSHSRHELETGDKDNLDFQLLKVEAYKKIRAFQQSLSWGDQQIFNAIFLSDKKSQDVAKEFKTKRTHIEALKTQWKEKLQTVVQGWRS